MAASSKLMITEAERRFPCRIKLGVPIGGLGARLTEMQAWLGRVAGSTATQPGPCVRDLDHGCW
jgi:hypothetical protein